MSNSTKVIEFLCQCGCDFEPDELCRAFQAAAKYGAKSALIYVIEKDHERCLQIEHYRGAFTSAAMRGRTKVVQYFLEHGTPVWSPDILKKPFVNAARRGYIGIVNLLISGMHEREAYRIILDQALNEACAGGQRAVAESLIIAGASVNASVDEVPELEMNTSEDELSVLERYYLRKRKCYLRNRRGQWPRTALQACLQATPVCRRDKFLAPWDVREAAVTRQESIVKLLLENGADVNSIGGSERTPLHSAVLSCAEDTVRAMIKQDANIHAWIPKRGTPLQCAASREVGSLPIVRILLEAGAEITNEGSQEGPSSPVLSAALALHVENGRFIESESLQEVLTTGPGGVIKLLLLSKPELQAKDERFSLVLQMAAAAGDGDFIQLLIDRKVDVNLPGHYFGCALQAASRFGHTDCVNRLLDAGAEVNMVQGSHGTPLQAAVAGAHIEVVRDLINRGADVNLRLYSSHRYHFDEEIAPIHAIQLAVASESLDVTRLLINAGAQIGPESPVLHLAVEARNCDMLRLLLRAGADVNSHDSQHSPVLIAACGHGDVEMVELLLESGADVNISGTQAHGAFLGYEASPLHKACAEGREEIVQILLKRGADPEKTVGNSATPLVVAARADHVGIMEQLLEAGAALYDPPRIPNILKEACSGRRPESTVEFLLQKLSESSTLTSACEEALSAAQQNEDEGSFILLMARLPKTRSILSQACMVGSRDAVELCLAHGVDINSDFDNGGRALHLAAYHQKSDLVPLLTQKGADICHVSSKYGTPVSAALEGLLAVRSSVRPYRPMAERFRAVLPELPFSRQEFLFPFEENHSTVNENQVSFEPCEKIVRILLSSGAVASTGPRPLGPPLHLAAYIGSLELAQILLEKGADINMAGGCFGSALLAAACGEHPEIIKFLLSRGIDTSTVSTEFGTALHYACEHRNRWLMQLLLDHGADVNSEGSKQESPLAALLAREDDRDWEETLDGDIELLLKYGDPLRIRTDDLLLAVTIPRYRFGEDLLKRLLDHDRNAPVTEELIGAAATNTSCSEDIVAILLDRGKGVEISPAILKAVETPEHLRLFLQHQPRCNISTEILEVLAKKEPYGRRLIEIILEKDSSVLPTASVVVNLLTTFRLINLKDLLRALFDRNPGIQVTETMLTAVEHPQELEFLLSRSPGISITQDILESAVSKSYSGSELLKVLLDHDKTLKAGSGVLRACTKLPAIQSLRLFLEHDPDLEFTEDAVLNILRPLLGDWNCVGEMTDLLIKYNKKLVFTPKIRKEIEKRFPRKSDSELKQRFLGLEKTD